MPSKDKTKPAPRVAIYARYSSDLQNPASIEDQIRVCRAEVERRGGEVVAVYDDAAISGASVLRPGYQRMLQDARDGRFDVVVAESLDRLSRDQEDVAALYKRMCFAGIAIVTLDDGEITDMHVGLKGTMNAMQLKVIADKTRRGLRGRVESGRSGGGKSYGYDVVKRIADNGELVRGDFAINEAQATVVRRIFRDYASGLSPRAIAKALNQEGVPSPSGKGWGPSTIHGNRRRGTGILNNELYIGRRVWNHQRYPKDPDTRRRVSRPNPESEWIIKHVPDLRIIDQELWDQVKARQGALKAARSGKGSPGYWHRRRPKYLFSGLMACAICGGGAVIWNNIRVGCANARNKGTCTNDHTMRRDKLEAAVLEGLQHHLMDPALMEVFCEEYTREVNQLNMERNAGRAGAQAELERLARDRDRLIQAIKDGVPASEVKDDPARIAERREVLEGLLSGTREEPVLLHPNMAHVYREQVADLRAALAHEDCKAEAAEILRKLIDRIELAPVTRDGKKTLSITLRGHLAGILGLAAKAKGPLEESDPVVECTKLVAGGGFEPPTFRL